MTIPPPTEAVVNKPARQSKRSWGWLVALIVLVLVVGGLIGSLLVTNAIATNQYDERIGAGGALGTITLPKLDADRAIPIIEGTGLEQLRAGVGWYEGSALPGQIGNCALAGHRLGWGQPFADLAALELGDEITVSTQDHTYTYRIITAATVVEATDNNILAAVPGDPGRQPTKALITLTTAASWLPSPDRLVVIGELVNP